MATYADPLPQARVLTAIVIGLATTVFAIVLALVAPVPAATMRPTAFPPASARRAEPTMTHAAIVSVLVPSVLRGVDDPHRRSPAPRALRSASLLVDSC